MSKAVAAALLLGCAEGTRVRSHRGASCGQKGFSMQIVNGADATECEWSWQVALKKPGQASQSCGGVLISKDWVLTAAHCVKVAPWEKFDKEVVVGEYKVHETSGKEQIRRVARFFRNPDYKLASSGWDFALLQLNESVELNECVGTVCLPTEGNDVVAGQSCWITGWGTLETNGSKSETLQEGKVKIISNDDCANKYFYPSSVIHESMICAQGWRWFSGRVDACQGDSGGPLVCQNKMTGTWTLYGVTSWGGGCADWRYPGVWARVHAALDWIYKTMEANPPPTSLNL